MSYVIYQMGEDARKGEVVVLNMLDHRLYLYKQPAAKKSKEERKEEKEIEKKAKAKKKAKK